MKHIIVGTAGHIDHGKSSLVHALTGMDPDRLKEEKKRGITIDLGFAHYQQDNVNFAFVDVPGHERFVRNMLAGVSGIDCVLLVIASDESVMPQTREHFDICRLLKVRGGLIVLTKTDLVDVETLELVQLEARELVSGSFLEEASIVPVSAKSGVGLDRLRAFLQKMSGEVSSRSNRGVMRLPIDRAFTVKGFGTVVTGTQVSGEMKADTDLEVLPFGRRVKLRALQVHGATQAISRAGQRVALNLTGVEVAQLSRGDTIVETNTLKSTQHFDVTLQLLANARRLKNGGRVRFHQGTAEVMARITLVASLVDLQTETPFNFLSAVEPGETAFGRIHLERPAALTRGDRYVLRAYSPPVTIAGGVILDPFPPRGRLRSGSGLARLHRLQSRRPNEALELMVEEAGCRGFSRRAIVSRAGMAPSEVDEIVESLVRIGKAVVTKDLLVSPDGLNDLRERILIAVATYHDDHPIEGGLPREEARERLGRRVAPAVFDQVIETLVEEGVLVATGRLALASHKIALSPEESEIRRDIESVLQGAGLRPPDIVKLIEILKSARALVEKMVKLLIREGIVLKVDALLFHVETLEKLKAEVGGLKSSGAEMVRIDVSTFKERYGVTRKYAIPLLEYLDRERVTRRVGNARIVL